MTNPRNYQLVLSGTRGWEVGRTCREIRRRWIRPPRGAAGSDPLEYLTKSVRSRGRPWVPELPARIPVR